MKTIFDRPALRKIFSSGAYIAIYTRRSGLRLFPNHVWCFPMMKLDGLVVSRVSGVGLGAGAREPSHPPPQRVYMAIHAPEEKIFQILYLSKIVFIYIYI